MRSEEKRKFHRMRTVKKGADFKLRGRLSLQVTFSFIHH
jgi:hypothetical protein